MPPQLHPFKSKPVPKPKAKTKTCWCGPQCFCNSKFYFEAYIEAQDQGQLAQATAAGDTPPDKRTICKHFLRGMCQQPKGMCRFSHDIASSRMPVCDFWLEGRCARPDCKFRHEGRGPRGVQAPPADDPRPAPSDATEGGPPSNGPQDWKLANPAGFTIDFDDEED